MKVYKSVGAVAVYSPARVATMIAGAVALVGGAGFAAGLVAGDDSGATSSAGVATVVPARPAAVPSKSATQTPRSADKGSSGAGSTTGGARAAYRRGFQNGIAALVGSPSAFRAGSSYLVRLRSGKGGAPFTIGPRVTVETGNTYSLCSHGQRICMKQGGLPGAP
jgi:hypothetical protein